MNLSPALLGVVEIYGQHFEWHDVLVVGLLVVLEGVLSIDNALVLGLLARRLPERLQKKALMYGLLGAFVFRLIAIGTASFLLRWNWAKLAGGGYLLWVAVKHFVFDEKPAATSEADPETSTIGEGSALTWQFWQAVIAIELTDIAFAVDSIVAAIALVGGQRADDAGAHDKLWVVMTGGFVGVIIMRFAAVMFIRLLRAFPRFELAAYLLVTVIGGKLLVDWGFNAPGRPPVVDFHDYRHAAFWVFWGLMVICFSVGFIQPADKPDPASGSATPSS